MNKNPLPAKLEALELQRAKNRLGYALSATAGLGAVKIGNMVTPRVTTAYASGKAFVDGSTHFLGTSIPNMAFILIGILGLSTAYSSYMVAHKKMQEERKKNPDKSNLFKL